MDESKEDAVKEDEVKGADVEVLRGLPRLEDCTGARRALELLWNAVPRSERPKLRGSFDGIQHVLQDVEEVARAVAGTAGGAGSEQDADEDEDGVAEVLEGLFALNPDEWEEVKVHMAFAELEPARRLRFADHVEDLYCFACGDLDEEGHACAGRAKEEAGGGKEDGGS